MDIAEKLEQNGKKWLQWGAILLVTIASYFYFFVFKNEKKNPYQALDTAFFSLSQASREEAKIEADAFNIALSGSPTLIPNYQGKAAKILIEKGVPEEASTWLKPLFKRVELAKYPEFHSFSNITLLISEGNLEEALKQSLALEPKEPTVAAHNLIRIALLQKKLGLPEYSDTLNKINSLKNSPEFAKALDSYHYKNLGLFDI